MDSDQPIQYPIEFLNSVESPEILPNNLALKVDSPIILLTNLDASRLWNDTKLCLKNVWPHDKI